MKEVDGYNISEEEFKKVSKWAENIYNIVIVVNYFIENQPEIKECYNLAPVIKYLLQQEAIVLVLEKIL